MHTPCSPDPLYREAIEISSSQESGLILLTLTLVHIDEADGEEMLVLLTIWWLRWIGTLNCTFFQFGDTWQLQCQIDQTNRAVLPQVMRDMLTIKNTGFI